MNGTQLSWVFLPRRLTTSLLLFRRLRPRTYLLPLSVLTANVQLSWYTTRMSFMPSVYLPRTLSCSAPSTGRTFSAREKACSIHLSSEHNSISTQTWFGSTSYSQLLPTSLSISITMNTSYLEKISSITIWASSMLKTSSERKQNRAIML